MRGLIATLQFGGAFTGFLIASGVYVVARRGNRTDFLLAGLLAMISLVLLRTGVSVSGLLRIYPHLLGAPFPLTYLIGPLLLFYVRAKVRREGFSVRRFWPHLLPTLASYLLLVPVFALSVEQKLLFVEMQSQPGTIQRAIEQFPPAASINLIQLFTVWAALGLYAFVAWRITATANENTLTNATAYERHWTGFLCLGLLAASLISFASMTGILGLGLPFLSPVLLSAYLVLVVVTAYSAVRLVIRPDMLQRANHGATSPTHLGPAVGAAAPVPQAPAQPGDMQAQTPSSRKKYEKSGLRPEHAEVLGNRLRQLMRRDALFRDPDLTHQALAGRAGCSPKHLSQVLNEKIGESFYDFVNAYRVEESKRILIDPSEKKTPVIDVALRVGFNNKPSFYNAFKKATGRTPAQFRAEHALLN